MRSMFALLLPLVLLAGCAAPSSSPAPEDALHPNPVAPPMTAPRTEPFLIRSCR